MGKQVWGEQGLLDQNTVAFLSHQLTVACVFEDPGRTHYYKFTEPLSWQKWHRALFWQAAAVFSGFGFDAFSVLLCG